MDVLLMNLAQYSGSIAALTVTAAPSMFYQNNYDDMLAIVRPYTTKKSKLLMP
jgi:mediator of RNA polymerase II transcription subunit 16